MFVKMVLKFHRQPRGAALVVVMILVAIIGMTVSSVLGFNVNQRWQEARIQTYQEELTAAEQAMDSIIDQVQFFAKYKPQQVGGAISNFHNAVLGIPVPAVTGFTIKSTISCVTGGNLQYTTINDASDTWNGYTMLRLEYKIHTEAKATAAVSQRFKHPGVALERVIRIQQIPLYAYAIFYGGKAHDGKQLDLELDAGQRIDIVGKVHTNGNFYLTTSSSAYYHRAITVAGTFYGGQYDPTTGRTGSGTSIYITTDGTSSPSNTSTMASVYGRTGNAAAFLTDIDILSQSPLQTQSYSGWLAESAARWKGYLRDSAQGIPQINLPIPNVDDPHLLIEPKISGDPSYKSDIKFANKADIVVTGDPATGNYTVSDSAGNVIGTQSSTTNLKYTDSNHVVHNFISTSSFYNGREGGTVYVYNVDMDVLGKVSALSGKLTNGVVYVQPTQPATPSSTYKESGVRLVNATSLPSNAQGALTVASNAPLYTKGDINSADNVHLLLAGDSMNILSANFNDANYTNATDANNPDSATPTTTNAIFIAGNIPSRENPGRYSGGAENYFRYLENWGSSNTHTFNGSILNLFESQIAKGPWDQDATRGTQSSPYYGAPRRIWSWDPALAGVTPPAGMPTFLEFSVMEWDVTKTT